MIGNLRCIIYCRYTYIIVRVVSCSYYLSCSCRITREIKGGELIKELGPCTPTKTQPLSLESVEYCIMINMSSIKELLQALRPWLSQTKGANQKAGVAGGPSTQEWVRGMPHSLMCAPTL